MKITAKAIYDKKNKKEKITMLSVYDFPFAKIADESGIDAVLVGDSLGMVLLGYKSTVGVTMREMIHHTRAVSRATHSALIVGDMPFGSYDTPEKAVRNATRFLKEGGAEAVKLEGGEKIKKEVEALVKAGIPVMGHLGMTPQTASALGGYKVQGRDKEQADEIINDAILLDKLGAFAIVLECVPAKLAAEITAKVKCPTLGIGGGAQTDGQVMVLLDMLGFSSKVHPRFVRKYADMEQITRKAVEQYRSDVLAGKFPSTEESY